MKIIILLTAFLISSTTFASGNIDKASCSYNGHKLYGKIQVVESFPDIKVQTVQAFPDVKVKTVDNFPNICGEWQMVNSFPDTKIQFVNSFPGF